MADSVFGSSLWAIVVVGGFMALGIAIAYAMMRNKVSRRENARTEAATHRLYQEQDHEDGNS